MVKAELIGFTSRLNPLSRIVDIRVRVDRSIIKIPIDYRQLRFVLKEHPVGSDVDLAYDGKWSIVSDQLSPDFEMDKWLYSTY
jgi:hypothetical protein